VQPLHFVDCSLFLGLLQTFSVRLLKLTVWQVLVQPSAPLIVVPVQPTARANACHVSYTLMGCFFDKFQDMCKNFRNTLNFTTNFRISEISGKCPGLHTGIVLF